MGGVYPAVRGRWTFGEPLVRIIGEALRHRLPTSGLHRPWVEAGALVAYNTDLVAQWVRMAKYVDKVLRGARPGDLPIETFNTFELILNLRTARELGLTIPPAMLARATALVQ